MNTKRILALVLGIMMMLPLALNGFAYSSPYQSLQTTSTATSKVTISGSSLNFDLFGTANVTPGTKTATASITDEKGALHLNNTGTTNLAYNTGNKGSANTSNQYSNFVSPTNGMTFDLYAKFKNLPKITSSTVMKDTGVVSGNPSNVYFSGLVFNLASAEKYMADTSKSNNELQAVFAYYDNKTLGTNTVLILPYGNRNSFASAPAVCYFFNTSQSSYDRYTLTFDPGSKTTQFFINGVAQKANGTGSTTFGSVALCYRATATVNFLNINLNNAQGGVSANNGTYKANVFIDQLNVYPTALVPNTTNFGFEGDPVPAVENQQMKDAKAIYDRLNPVAADYYNPTFWNAFKGWIDYCYNIVNNGGDQATLDAACTGTSGNWFINRLGWRTTAGKDATSGGSSVTVAGTGVVLPAATPIAVNVDRIALSHSVYNGTTDAYAWTNSAFIWTKAGMRMSDYKAYNNNLNNVAEYDEWYALKCLPTKAAGIYRVSELGKNCDLDVPEGGFLVVVYADGGFANNILLNSTKTSDQFAIRNYHAINALNLQKDDYVRLENVTLNDGAAATLSTSGTWYCVGDSRIPSGTGKSDYFSNFKTASCLVKVDETTLTPDASIKLTVAGTGSVSAKVDGTAVATPADFGATVGSTVTVTASGNNFLYWKNKSNDAILSTDVNFTFTYGGATMELVAVFASTSDTSSTHTVTFKDGLTGKILSTVTVARGSKVTSTPAVTAAYGYVFKGFYTADGVLATDYAVNANTTFYARYKSDDSAFFNLTITDGTSTEVKRVRYAKVVNLEATSASFTNWNMNGKFYASTKAVQFSMPNADCTVATVNNGSKTFTPSISFISNFVDDNGALMSTFVRDLPAGYTLVESGILMTRKAVAEHLVVDTLVATVTKGISKAAANENVFGFIKSDIVSKAGTWLVRGYLLFKDANGDVDVVYTNVESVQVGEKEQATTFTLMSHNMKNGNSSYSAVAQNATNIGADFVCLQEAGSYYISSTDNAFTNAGYTALRGEKRDNTLSAEYNPIYYNADKFLKHNEGTFWLSDTPDSMSKFSGLKYYRICHWAVFECKATGEFVQVFNTHLCATAGTEGVSDTETYDVKYRFAQVKVLLERIELVARNCPSGVNNLILTGDFNMIDTHGVLKYLTGSAAYNSEWNTVTGSRFRLAKTVAIEKVPNSSGNFNTIDATGSLSYSFDHAFVDIAGIQVDEFGVISNAAGSDHLPVYTKCTLK